LTGSADAASPGVLGRLGIRHLYPLIAVALYPFLAAGPLGDNSFLWHVRAGAAQWDLRRVLDADLFSYTMEGQPWRTQSWLAELIYAGLEGATGTVMWAPVLVTVIGVAALALIGVAMYGATRSTFSTAVWLVIAVWLAGSFAHPRPVIFSYLLLAALVLILRLEDGFVVHRSSHHPQQRQSLSVNHDLLWAVVPLIWVWGALHGSWLIGIGLLVLEAVRRRSWKVASVAGLSMVAVTFTAHGLGIWHIVWQFATNRDALQFLGEWGPPNFGDIVQGPFFLIIAGILVAAVRGRISLNDLWIVLPFMLAGRATERTVFPATIVLLPYAAAAFEVRIPEASRRPATLAWVVAVLVVLVGAAALWLGEGGFSEERFPNDEVLASIESDRFFHDDAVGGYLIYRDWPGAQVYIDDRAELYGAEAFAELRSARTGAYEEVFERYGMTEAIVKPDWQLRDRLERDGWTVVVEDEFFLLMRK
jgi:hypothetical protein